jgi:hypothetical protein
MRMSQKLAARLRMIAVGQALILCFTLVLCCAAQAQQGKHPDATAGLTGSYEGTAKNEAGEVIPVTIDLTEKEGALSGTIRSSHGDFTITAGSHQGEAVHLEFDAGGSTGTVSLKLSEEKLSGTWSAGEDGGPIDVKKVAPQGGGNKGKS